MLTNFFSRRREHRRAWLEAFEEGFEKLRREVSRSAAGSGERTRARGRRPGISGARAGSAGQKVSYSRQLKNVGGRATESRSGSVEACEPKERESRNEPMDDRFCGHCAFHVGPRVRPWRRQGARAILPRRQRRRDAR